MPIKYADTKSTANMFMHKKEITSADWVSTLVVKKNIIGDERWNQLPDHIRMDGNDKAGVGLYIDIWKIKMGLVEFHCLLCGCTGEEVKSDVDFVVSWAKNCPLISMTNTLVYPWGKIRRVQSDDVTDTSVAKMIDAEDAKKFAAYIMDYDEVIRPADEKDYQHLFDEQDRIDARQRTMVPVQRDDLAADSHEQFVKSYRKLCMKTVKISYMLIELDITPDGEVLVFKQIIQDGEKEEAEDELEDYYGAHFHGM